MKDLIISIRRTPYQSLAAFFVLFFTLFLSIVIIFSLSLLYSFLGYVETRPQVTVYFRAQTNQNEVFKVRDALISSGKVLSVKYISQKDAFKIYQNLNKNNPLLLEMISSNIFPSSLEIYAKKPVFLPEIAEFLKKQRGVDEVDFQKIIMERLLTLTNIVRKAALAFFIFLSLTTLINLFTITHFKVALKKDEIELYKLLGASNFYIKKPFLAEALLFGLLSGITAFATFAGVLFGFAPYFSNYLNGINQLSVNLNFFELIIWPLNISFLIFIFVIVNLFGIITSTFASFLATQKYIK